MIKFIIVVIYLVFFALISCILQPLMWLIGLFSKRARDIMSLRIVQWAFKVVRFVGGIKTTVIGFENIPKDEPVLFVGNHKSYFDIIISYSVIRNRTGFVAKDGLEKIPLLRGWMKLLYCLFLNRDNIKEGLKTILQGIEYIKEGVSIAIFPEGTTSKTDEMLPFKEGSLKFAEKSGCKIIPMVQNNTRACWEAQMPKIRRTHTVLEFCEPIEIDKLSKEEKKFLGAHIRKIIEDTYNKNKALV